MDFLYFFFSIHFCLIYYLNILYLLQNLDRITIIFVNYKILIKYADLAKTCKIQIDFTDLTKKKWVLVFFERFRW